ncbi:TetR/AcrR family transcriptional regulator [bacterium]|nr:TetR/AcrR family transcriptional regulator [bacterium]
MENDELRAYGTASPLYQVPKGYERRMQIVAALSSLFAEHSIDEINISMICEEAHISRPTFYRYFNDKHEVINWYHLMYSQQVLYQVGKTLTWHEATVLMFQHVLKERDFYRRAYAESDTFESLTRITEHTSNREHLATFEANGVPVTKELVYELKFWNRSVNAAIKQWANDGFSLSPEDFAHYLDCCRPSDLQHAMDDPVLRRRRQSSEAYTLG